MKFDRFSRKQMQVLTWWKNPAISARYGAIICDGSVRSGKTLSMGISFVLWAMSSYSGQSFAICGKTVSSCGRNVITPLLDALRGIVRTKQCHSSNYIDVWFGGSCNRFYIFGGKDEGSAALIQGITLAGVLLDEVALMPRSFVEQALARCSVEGARFWFNCNPEHPAHWFYTEWIQKAQEKRALHLHFTMEDNLSLSDETRERYYSLYSGVFYKRFILGEWVTAEGLVYPMFNRETHVVPSVDRKYTRYYVSVDYGTMNPTSMGLWGPADGIWYRIREYYHSGRDSNKLKTDEQYYTELEKLVMNLPVSAVIVDPSAASFITCIASHGRFRVDKAVNDVLNGIRGVSEELRRGSILFNDCCTDTLLEFSAYVWDDRCSEDRPVKANDHAMDDIRYFVSTVIAGNRVARVGKSFLGGVAN